MRGKGVRLLISCNSAWEYSWKIEVEAVILGE